MSELMTERTVLTTLAVIGVLGMFVMLCRARRVSTSVEDATLAALHRVSAAGPALRSGLTLEATDRATPHLRQLLNCVAIGLADESRLLSWDGEANHHYQDLSTAIDVVVSTGKREHVNHGDLDCDRRSCPMRHALVVPLTVEGEVLGALVVIAANGGKRLIRASTELAHYVSGQLELAELQESRERLARAEVQALRAQISPHFVYNALNTISSLVRTDPDEARDLLQDFAEFTRYAFRATGMFTTLAEELRNVDRYLTLERARYGEDRLRVQLRIAPEVLPVVVPFLVLQPLVENAVRHGLAGKKGGGTVTVAATDVGSEALISVEDDGIGMDPARLNRELATAHLTGAHVGLGNIHDRMQSVFGDQYGLVVETNVGAGMRVMLRVPKFAPGVRPETPPLSEPEPLDDLGPDPELGGEAEGRAPVSAPRPEWTGGLAERVEVSLPPRREGAGHDLPRRRQPAEDQVSGGPAVRGERARERAAASRFRGATTSADHAPPPDAESP
ncbi:histidine kinase [Actinoalloteichus caeruleus]|uniref:histidine kinase n=1 Tax=Actinoalloteichus cyanogriseus TaxID=2893586 RepID=UPI003BB868BC